MESKLDARQGVQSVEMMLRVLFAVAEGPGPRALKDICAATGLAPSSVHRHLVTLVRTGMAEQSSATSKYEIGARALQLGLKALGQREPVRLASATLEDLRDELGHSVFLTVWAAHGPTIVRWEEGSRPVTVNVRVGSVLPLVRSATGRVFLAWLPSAVTEPLLREEKVGSRELAKLRKETRERGLGSVSGELLPGIASLSAPIFDHRGQLVAAITAVGPEGGFDTAPRSPVGTRLKQATEALSKRLCYEGSLSSSPD